MKNSGELFDELVGNKIEVNDLERFLLINVNDQHQAIIVNGHQMNIFDALCDIGMIDSDVIVIPLDGIKDISNE